MSLLPSRNGSSGEISSLRKRRCKAEEADERESSMIDICHYKVYSGPFTAEERDYLLELGYLQLGQDGEYHEIETESDSDEDDRHDAIAKELKKSEQLLRSFAQVDGSAEDNGNGPVNVKSGTRCKIQDGCVRRENSNSFSPHGQRSSGKKIGFLGLKKKTGILVRAFRKKCRK